MTDFELLKAYQDTGLEPEEVQHWKACFSPPTMQHLIEMCEKIEAERDTYRALGPIEELSALVKAQKEGRVVVLPCKVGEWLYYLLDDKVRKAKVEEIQCSAYKHNPQFNVTVFAWDFSAKEQLTYCPAGDSWTDNSRGFVRVFLTPAEAEAAIGGGGDG